MLDSLFSVLAPHYCLSCGQIGRQICEHCFYDIELSLRQTCLRCHKILHLQQCGSCVQLRGVNQIVLAHRDGLLERVVDEYKFECRRESHRVIAQLLDTYAPNMPRGTHIVPIPTALPHIRRRGFDHTRDIYKRFASLRGHYYTPLLSRCHSHAQFGASVSQRQKQAASAYTLNTQEIDLSAHYVVCDDIVTTGASVTAATKLLRTAGARDISILALLQQPWKK